MYRLLKNCDNVGFKVEVVLVGRGRQNQFSCVLVSSFQSTQVFSIPFLASKVQKVLMC